MIHPHESSLNAHQLEDGHLFYTGRLPDELILSDEQFAEVWNLHPEAYHEIKIHGRYVKTPRWQQAYGNDYHYTGRVNKALPVPQILQPLLDWAREQIDEHLNGVLLNWYDAGLKHYIGEHHDSTIHMIDGAPIVTMSFGEERIFRLSQGKGQSRLTHDFPVPHGSVCVMPYDTNLAWKHSVPFFARYKERRISVTLRAFETEEPRTSKR